MKKQVIILTWFLLTACTFGNLLEGNHEVQFVLDPSIHMEVEKFIRPLQQEYSHGSVLTYNNCFIGEFYSNDSLFFSSNLSDSFFLPFRSGYYWNKDTLEIIGRFESMESLGFGIKIVGEEIYVTNLLLTNKMQIDTIENQPIGFNNLEVSCIKSSLVLSDIPDLMVSSTVFGKLDFITEEFKICDFKTHIL